MEGHINHLLTDFGGVSDDQGFNKIWSDSKIAERIRVNFRNDEDPEGISLSIDKIVIHPDYHQV